MGSPRCYEDEVQSSKIETCILDRSAISVLVYSKAMEFGENEFLVLEDLYKSVNWCEKILIYLEAKPETILDRIKKRGSLEPERLEWNEDDLKYIKVLEHHYNAFLFKIKGIKVIRFDTDNLSIEECADQIQKIIEDNIRKHDINPNQTSLSNYFS